MSVKCPTLSEVLVVADDARLAAQLSCKLARSGAYLPVIDGPRLARPDHDAEVIRRSNAAARVKPSMIVFAGLSGNSCDALAQRLRSRRIERVSTSGDLERFPRDGPPLKTRPLTWGRDRIGVGLLSALRSRSTIVFTNGPSPIEHVPSKSGHLVVCEEGNDLSQVIAANYAFALGAGLCVIPEVEEPKSEQILENFYNLYEERRISQTEALKRLNVQLRELCGPLPVPDGGSITFITGGLPYGIAWSDFPSTHLFKYPDLGISVINGLAAEQSGTRGIGVAVLVDPETTDAPEIAAAAQLLPPKGVFVRGYRGSGASARSFAEMIELFPYDLLIVATHCGDASGYRWTYEFTDSEGVDRRLVVDVAIGVARTMQDDVLNVTQFTRFVSLDGVDWYDPDKSEKLNVGSAIRDYVSQVDDLEPVETENIPRVVGSAALRMFGNNYIALPRPLAERGTPIIINNACGSWHRLAETFTFGNARAYFGTLFMVTTSEANEVVVRLLGKHFGKPLPVALWSAQREVYGNSVRRPYVMTGVYPQRLRVASRDMLQYIARRLSSALGAWRDQLRQADPSDNQKMTAIKEFVDFYERELTSFRSAWFKTQPRDPK